MKKLLIALCILTTTTIFCGCKHEKIEDYGQGITVIFGDQENWHAQKNISQIIGNKLYLYAFKEKEAYQFPYLYLQIDLQEGYVIVYEKNFNIMENVDTDNYIEYYMTNNMSDGIETHGDWWAKNGNINITQLDYDKKLLSCEIIVDMFNAVERYVDGNNDYSTNKMRVIINDLPLENQRKALATE